VVDVGETFATEMNYLLTLFEGQVTYKELLEMDRRETIDLKKAKLESLRERRKATGNIDKIVEEYTRESRKKR